MLKKQRMKNIQTELMQTVQQSGQRNLANTEPITSDVFSNLLDNHISSFLKNDLKAIMRDYTNDSVLITQAATYTGLPEIESFFANLITYFPVQSSNFELDKMVFNGDMAYIVWHATTPSLEVPLGSDTFIIRDSKIYQQTFVGQLNFIN